MKNNGNKAFSSIDFVGQCLFDEKRVSYFQKAIKQVVKKNDIALDMGTGSGIMSLIAARAGAKKVFAVEFDRFVSKIAEIAIKANNFKNKINLVIKDACRYNFPRKIKFNVVISEMLTTGMVDEAQVRAINNLHEKKLVDNSTVFLPLRQDTYVSLVNANFKTFGFKIPMVIHLWRWHRWNNLNISKITDQAVLNSVNFNKRNKEKFEAVIILEAKKTGIVNGLCLKSRTFLTDSIFVEDTEALNAPMLIPILERPVKKGQKLKLKISYIFGGGYEKFKAKFIS